MSLQYHSKPWTQLEVLMAAIVLVKALVILARRRVTLNLLEYVLRSAGAPWKQTRERFREEVWVVRIDQFFATFVGDDRVVAVGDKGIGRLEIYPSLPIAKPVRRQCSTHLTKPFLRAVLPFHLCVHEPG